MFLLFTEKIEGDIPHSLASIEKKLKSTGITNPIFYERRFKRSGKMVLE